MKITQRTNSTKSSNTTFKSIRKIDTTKLYDMSVNAAELLNLPKDKFFDLYFRGNERGEITPSNLLKGMHADAIMSIIKYHGYSFEIEKKTEDLCKVRFSLDNGKECSYEISMNDAKCVPWIQKEFLKEDSLWNTDPADMLLHEACKMVAKTCFKRLFRAKSKTVLEDGGKSDNKTLAKGIMKEWIFDIQSVDFDYERKICEFVIAGNDAGRERFSKNILTTSLKRITASLDLCDALNLPKETFYDISKHDEFHADSPLYGIKSAFIYDILREKGHIIVPEKISRKVCTIKFDLEGVEHCRQVVLQSLVDTKEKIKTDLLDPESVWNNHTEIMLFYETIREAVSKTSLKTLFGGSKRSRCDAKKILLDFLEEGQCGKDPLDAPQKMAKDFILEASDSLDDLDF